MNTAAFSFSDLPASTWAWPLPLAYYDRRPLSAAEHAVLGTLVARRKHSPKLFRFGDLSALSPTHPLVRLMQPLLDAWHVAGVDRQEVTDGVALLVAEMHRRGATYWAWSEADWVDLLGRSFRPFQQRHHKAKACRLLLITFIYIQLPGDGHYPRTPAQLVPHAAPGRAHLWSGCRGAGRRAGLHPTRRLGLSRRARRHPFSPGAVLGVAGPAQPPPARAVHGVAGIRAVRGHHPQTRQRVLGSITRPFHAGARSADAGAGSQPYQARTLCGPVRGRAAGLVGLVPALGGHVHRPAQGAAVYVPLPYQGRTVVDRVPPGRSRSQSVDARGHGRLCRRRGPPAHRRLGRARHASGGRRPAHGPVSEGHHSNSPV